MKSVVTEVTEGQTLKYSTDPAGYKRIMGEQEILMFLKDSPHTPTILKVESDTTRASITMQTIHSKSLREILDINDEYSTKPRAWKEAKKLLEPYVEAEMDLLARGALYRDMNLDHILFAHDKTYLIDLESTIINTSCGKWILNDMRGTWETMAPEEFPGYGELSTRTATYRVAVIAYIILTGKLPFKRFPDSRSETHHWRMRHPVEAADMLSKDIQQVFKIGLARKPTHRYKDPLAFLKQLEKSQESH